MGDMLGRPVVTTIRDEGGQLPVRAYYNFVGAGVTATDDPTSLETEVTIPGVSGAQTVTRRSVAAPYEIGPTDHEVWVTSAGTVTIPSSQNADGRRLLIKNRVAAGGTVTLDPEGAATIDGVATYDLLVLHESVTLTGDGTNWGRSD